MLRSVLYDWGGLNVWLFHAINDVHGHWLDAFMRLGTTLGGHANFPLYLAIAALIGWFVTSRSSKKSNQAAVWLGVLTVFSVAYVLDGWLLGWLKPYLDFPRPPLALPMGDVIVVGQLELHHSLPSGHASFAMLIAASFWPLLGKPRRILMGLFVLWVGLSRISLGAHFPADVAAGFLSSLVLVLLMRFLLKRWV